MCLRCVYDASSSECVIHGHARVPPPLKPVHGCALQVRLIYSEPPGASASPPAGAALAGRASQSPPASFMELNEAAALAASNEGKCAKANGVGDGTRV